MYLASWLVGRLLCGVVQPKKMLMNKPQAYLMTARLNGRILNPISLYRGFAKKKSTLKLEM